MCFGDGGVVSAGASWTVGSRGGGLAVFIGNGTEIGVVDLRDDDEAWNQLVLFRHIRKSRRCGTTLAESKG